MADPRCDLQVHINGQQSFFLNQRLVSAFSVKLRKMIKQEKRKSQMKNLNIDIDNFPGGPDGFELVSQFCYNNGRVSINVSNVSLLHCCGIYLGMTEKVSANNLVQQTDTFLQEVFYWSWTDVLTCLRSCETFFQNADVCGLMDKLICSLLAKIAENSDIKLIVSGSSSSSSSPELSSKKAWWFDDLSILPPKIIEKVIKTLGAYGSDNNSLILTKFIVHYLKKRKKLCGSKKKSSEYSGLADTAVHGVILVGKSAFSCRGMFWVLRAVCGLSKDCRMGLEKLIGGVLDEASLDELLVCGHDGVVYDVNLVLRLVRVFVNEEGICVERLRKVGKLIDKYLGEISPDLNLKVSKFLQVAESLPASARDCFDGVYRAIDIYLQSHQNVAIEERSRLCRCLNYEKLSLEACKDLAKNPRIPPKIAVEALISQQQLKEVDAYDSIDTVTKKDPAIVADAENISEENEDVRMNLERMQWRVVELENVCKDMKGQMTRLVKSKVLPSPPHNNRAFPRLC